MIKYFCENESQESSRFVLYGSKDSIYMLCFDNKDVEEINFNDDFLQDNIIEMNIVKVTKNKEACCKDIAATIKTIFDSILFQYSDKIVYISVPTKSAKQKLIKRFINEDKNSNFIYIGFSLGDITFYFFFNDIKTNFFQALESLYNYFKNEYGLDFTINNILKLKK